MSFALVGSLITQTGTDANLSGIGSIAGVTTLTFGTKSIYDLGSLRLEVQGTLSWDSEDECLLIKTGSSSSAGLRINGGGVTIGEDKGSNPDGSTRYSRGIGLMLTNATSSTATEWSWIESSGTLTVNGSEIHMAHTFGIRSNSGIVTLNETVFLSIANPTGVQAFRVEGDDTRLVANNIVVDSRDVVSNLFFQNGIDVYSADIRNAFIQPVNGSWNAAIVLKNISFAKNSGVGDWRLSSGSSNDNQLQPTEITNVDTGSGIRVTSGGITNRNHLALFHEVDFTAQDSLFSLLDDVKVVCESTDNGNRTDPVGSNFRNGRTFTGTDFDKYTGASVSGIIPTLTILTAQIWDASRVAEDLQYNLYSNTNTIGTDDFTFNFCAYDKSLFTATLVLQGSSALAQTVTLIDDELVTEATKATVDAYPITVSLVGTTLTITGDSATLQTLTTAQFYDAVKGYLYDNFDGETQTIVTRVGTQLDARALDVTLDYITMTGSLTTTGTVTLSNGSTVSGGIIDAVADSFLSFSGIDSWTVYASAANRDSNTSALDNGTVSDNYRFNFSGGTTYYLRLTSGSSTIFQDSTPVASGETEVSLSTAALLTGISSSLGNIPKAVFLNVAAASNGNGSAASPYNDVGDAIDLAVANSITTIYVDGDPNDIITMPKAATGLTFLCRNNSVIMNINGQNVNGSEFHKIVVTGAFVVADSVTLMECGISAVTGFKGVIVDCSLAGNITFSGDSSVYRSANSSQAANPTMTVSGNTAVAIRDYKGAATIAGVTGAAAVTIDSSSADITLAASCTGGTITVRGSTDLTDSSAGSTVTKETLPVNTRVELETTGNMLELVKELLYGKYVRDASGSPATHTWRRLSDDSLLITLNETDTGTVYTLDD